MTEERAGNPFGEAPASATLFQPKLWRPLASKLFILGGLLMAPVCGYGLLWQKSFMWGICPQALVVMFFRQWQHAYDSPGAAGYADLATAIFYYPLMGRILSRAVARGRLRIVVAKIVVWHILAIGLAVGTGAIRNQLWGF